MNSLHRALARIVSSKRTTGSRPRLVLSHSLCSTSACKSINVKATATASEKSELPTSINWPKPTELLFQPKVANSVKMIGKVSSPILSGYSADGKFWAATTIIQDSSSFRIPLKFEGDLAHIAVTHLNTSSCIYVAGQLSADPPPIDLSKDKSEIQVMVHNINFVQGSFQTNLWTFEKKEKGRPTNPALSNTEKDGDDALNPWRSLLENPKEWWDYRGSKLNGLVNPKFPDFKRKDGGQSIWLNKAPKWVLSKLEGVEFDVKITKSKEVNQHTESKQVKPQKGEESWKDLIENPKKWWDNRVDKKNVKAPDFKHKETGEALWLDSSPPWVQSKLPPKSGQGKAGINGDTLLS